MDTAKRERPSGGPNQKWTKEELDICVNFWLKTVWTTSTAAYTPCLDRKGEIYSTDKSGLDAGPLRLDVRHLCHQYVG